MPLILVADDDAAFCEMMRDRLVTDGYEVDTVSDGGQLAARLDGGAFQAAILDMQMPMGGGVAAARLIRARFANLVIPIIVCTGMPVEKAKEWFSGMAKLAVFQKPPDLAALMAELSRLLTEA